MNKKTKTILIISFSLLFVGVCIGVYFLLTIPPKTYPKEPVKQTSLYTTSQKIDLDNKELESADYPLLGVSNTVILENVEKFAIQLDPKMKNTSSVIGKFYKWENKENYVIYELEQNTVLFSLSNGITWDEADISDYTFKSFAKQYFGKDWEYKMSFDEKDYDGFAVYYANRLFNNHLIQTNEYNGETDFLAFKDGKIMHGKVFVTEFFDTEKTLPLLNSRGLQKYINLDNYPKEIYPNYSTLADSVLKEVNYLSDDFEEIATSVDNCAGDTVEVVYLYKNFNQETLTPVYKIALQCEVTYKNTKYTIPAIGYVNAVDPKYISIPE